MPGYVAVARALLPLQVKAFGSFGGEKWDEANSLAWLHGSPTRTRCDPPMTPPIIPSVLDRHAEEAAFLWLLRDRAVARPQYTLDTLAELDQRVEAHLDGLRVAGEAGPGWPGNSFWNIASLARRSPPRHLAFETASTDTIQVLLEAAEASPGMARAVVSAVGWLTDDAAALALPLLHAWGTPIALRIGLAGAAIRRTPIPARVLDAGLRDPACRARAIKAIAEMGDTGRLAAAREHLGDGDLEVRFGAAWTVARLAGEPRAVAELQTIALTESRYRQRAAALVVRRPRPGCGPPLDRNAAEIPGSSGSRSRRRELTGIDVRSEATGSDDCHAVGTAGRRGIRDDHRHRLAEVNLNAPRRKGWRPHRPIDPEDALVDLDPDDGLDWPDPEKVRKWWTTKRGRIPGRREVHLRPTDHSRKLEGNTAGRVSASACGGRARTGRSSQITTVRSSPPAWRQRIV